MKLHRLAATAVAAMALLGACGDDGETASKEEFIAKGDALCAENLRKQAPIENKVFVTGGSPTLEKWKELFDGIAPINAEMFSEFKKLDPPSADRERFKRWTAMEDDIQAKMEAAGQAAGSGDQQRFDAALEDLNRTSAPLEADLRAYGFKVCGAESDDGE